MASQEADHEGCNLQIVAKKRVLLRGLGKICEVQTLKFKVSFLLPVDFWILENESNSGREQHFEKFKI